MVLVGFVIAAVLLLAAYAAWLRRSTAGRVVFAISGVVWFVTLLYWVGSIGEVAN